MKLHIPVLTYHRIGQPGKDCRLEGLYVSPQKFREQMEYLCQAGYRSVTLGEFVSALYRKTIPPDKGMLITFDDGSRSILHSAWPILKEYGMTATVFVIPGCVGGDSQWTVTKEKQTDPLLNWEEILYLQSLGLDFASHALTHVHLPNIKEDLAREELQASRKILEEKLNRPVLAIAYPYGQYNQRIMEMSREAGYQCAFSTRRGNCHSLSEAYRLRRITMPPDLSLQHFKYRLSRIYDWEHRIKGD